MFSLNEHMDRLKTGTNKTNTRTDSKLSLALKLNQFFMTGGVKWQ